MAAFGGKRRVGADGASSMRGAVALAVAALGALPVACSKKDSGPAGPHYVDPPDLISSIKDAPSCVLDCASGTPCDEARKPWTCPALADYASLPHDPSCPAYDGTPPPATTGACTATDPTGDALAKTSFGGTPVILPDGRRLTPAGTEWVFDEADVDGGFPVTSVLVPGTKWLVVIDAGYGTHAVRAVDTTVLRGGAAKPVASYVRYPIPKAINYGVAVHPTTKTIYVAGGTPDSKVLAFDLDAATGKLTENAARAVTLPKDVVGQGLDVSPDGKTLLVGEGKDSHVYVFSLDDASYGKALGSIDVGASDVFAVRFDPSDKAGNTAYATCWIGAVELSKPNVMRLAQLDVGAKKARIIPVGKAPEEIAFLDARWAVVANSLSDTLSIVDRPASNVAAEVPVAMDPAVPHGAGPSALAWDAPRKRLYVTLADVNGVAAYDVDLTGASPTLTPAGIFATAWWPTGVAVDPADGAVFVTNGKGHGTGADKKLRGFTDGEVADLMKGSVQAVPFMDATALAAATKAFKAASTPAAILGYSSVQCNGAPYDFPLPAKPEDGPSARIKHVVFVVRENKTFDDLFGDLPSVDGDPSLVMAQGRMDDIWPNARKIATSFSHMDNFYSDAEQSIQGHAWTVMGRTSDYEERRWTVIWGRGEFGVGSAAGVGGNTTAMEGNVFDVLKAGGVGVQNMGDLYAIAYRDTQWPGGTTDSTIPDTLGACYLAARARAACDMVPFTYVWLVNDHAWGQSASRPNPAVAIATNDEATGMLLDGISHSPMWKDTLVVVVEDDPNTGADHVDLHRTIALFASPWVKRGYVSRAHYDIASVHKVFAHVFGRPYWSATIANAPLPLDLFTSTPDYTPFTYVPRKFTDLSCNPSGTTGAKEAEDWDFSEPDDQPGLSRQNWESLRSLGDRGR